MTGPEHYQEAERLAAKAASQQVLSEMISTAQVHATLALAAATALGLGRADDHGMLDDDANAWQDAAGISVGGAE